MTDYTISLRREYLSDGSECWVAYHPEMDGCLSQGSTPAEAIEMLCEAREMWLEATERAGLAIPLPLAGQLRCSMYAPKVKGQCHLTA